MDDLQPMTHREALARGMTGWQLRGAPWERPHYGVVSPDHLDPDDPMVRISNALPLLTGTTLLTGWAAARWQGNRMLDGIGRDGQQLPIILVSPDGGQHRHRAGVVATRRSMLAGEWLTFEQIRVATLARAIYDHALEVCGLRETVVAIDMGVSTVINQSRTSLGNVVSLVERHGKTRGIVRVRAALHLVSPRSASPWETRTRLVAELDADITGLKVNVPVFDLHDNLLGIADLLDSETGLVIESDGAHHREQGQHTEDNHREEKFERAQMVVCRVTSLDHRDRRGIVGRIIAARRDAARTHSQQWTLEKPGWWWAWKPGRRYD